MSDASRAVPTSAPPPPEDLQNALQAAIAALESVEEAVFVADVGSLGILAVNRAARELLDGRSAIGRPLEWLFPDEDPTELRRRVRALVRTGGRSMGMHARVVWEDRQGRRLPVRLDVVRRDDVPLVVGFVRTTPEERVLRPVRGDVLAALPTREDLLAALAAEVRRAFRHGRDLAVVALRIELPALLRDRAEEEAAVLAGVAERLRGATRAEEPLARVDRRGFAWLLPETGAAGARSAAERARAALGGHVVDAGVEVRVGVAALVRGDTALSLLRRAEADTEDDPGAGGRPDRSAPPLRDEPAALLRAASEGDARAVEHLVADALARHGHARAYDEVLQRVMGHLGRSANERGPERSARQHRAAALLEWAVARRPDVHPPPDGPVAVLVPFGVDVRRVTLPAATDAAAAAGWMPVVLGLPTAAEATRPIVRLEARAVLAVIGDDSDLLEAGHLLRVLGESVPRMPLFAVSAPGGIMRRWRPPAGVHPLESSRVLEGLLRAARDAAAGGQPTSAPPMSDPTP